MNKIFAEAGCYCEKKAEYLKPVLKSWATAVSEYADVWGTEDVAYYYNERANISLLAAGAWKSEWIALEEYRSQKFCNKRKSTGRVDLYISDKIDHHVMIEAKHAWMRSDFSDSELRIRVNEYINKAKKDARCNRGAPIRCGCVFFVPRFSVDDFTNETAEVKIIIEIKRYLNSRRMDAWAWSFPAAARLTHVESENSYYPGILIGLEHS